MKTILVPTDFSPVSLNAANYAIDMASAINADILLLNVYQIPLAYSGEVPLALLSIDDLRKDSETQLEDVKEKLRQRSAGKIIIKTQSRMGDTTDELESICAEVKPFAVVMGAKGKTGLQKIVIGSTTLSAIRHLVWPVICVPPGKEYGNGIKKIGFACDFKEVSATTPAASIKEITKQFNAALYIINVDYKEKHFKPSTPEESYKLHAMFSEVSPSYHFISNPDVEDGILEFVQANNLDLIIAIPQKHKLLDGLFKPSSTKQLVFMSQVPVLCIHE